MAEVDSGAPEQRPIEQVNLAGPEALYRWDKLMAGVGDVVTLGGNIASGIALAAEAAKWFNARLKQREEEQMRIDASEMFPQKRDFFLRKLIEAREAEVASHTSLTGLSDEAAKSLLELRALTPTAEQLGRYWTLAGKIPILQKVPGQYTPLDAITIEVEMRRIAAPRTFAPLNTQGSLLNLLEALELTPDEAERIGEPDLLLQWTEDRAKREVPFYAELRDQMIAARDAEQQRYADWAARPAILRRVAEVCARVISNTAVLRSLRDFVRPWLLRELDPRQQDVATYWALTGAAPDEQWNRGQILSEVRRLQKFRGVPVNQAAALERLCDILQLAKVPGRPRSAPALDDDQWRQTKTVSYEEPDYAAVSALTPWPNERTGLEPTAADYDFADEIRSEAYKPAMRGETPIGDRFLGADGWYYLFLPEAPAQLGGTGRVIMRRGKYYDELPAWLYSDDIASLWSQLKDKRAMPVDLEREMSAALRGSEEALHDFWRVVGYNPPGHVVGFAAKVLALVPPAIVASSAVSTPDADISLSA